MTSEAMAKISKAEFKRRLQPGVRLECLQHRIAKYVGTRRTITKARSVDVRFTLDGDPREHCMRFDMVTEVRANANEIEVYSGEPDPWMRFQVIEAVAAPEQPATRPRAPKTPEYRDMQTLTTASLWRDRRDGATAVVWNGEDGVRMDDLDALFRHARHCGFEITRKRPLIVYGTLCFVAGVDTLRFIQVTRKQLAEMDAVIFAATCSTAVAS